MNLDEIKEVYEEVCRLINFPNETITISAMKMLNIASALGHAMDRIEYLEALLKDANKQINNFIGDGSVTDSKEILNKANEQAYLSGFDFSVLMHKLLISEDGYVLNTGNYENVNAEVALRLVKKIKEHPEFWRLFMVA